MQRVSAVSRPLLLAQDINDAVAAGIGGHRLIRHRKDPLLALDYDIEPHFHADPQSFSRLKEGDFRLIGGASLRFGFPIFVLHRGGSNTGHLARKGPVAECVRLDAALHSFAQCGNVVFLHLGFYHQPVGVLNDEEQAASRHPLFGVNRRYHPCGGSLDRAFRKVLLQLLQLEALNGQILIELSQLKLLFERLKGAFGIPVGQLLVLKRLQIAEAGVPVGDGDRVVDLILIVVGFLPLVPRLVVGGLLFFKGFLGFSNLLLIALPFRGVIGILRLIHCDLGAGHLPVEVIVFLIRVVKLVTMILKVAARLGILLLRAGKRLLRPHQIGIAAVGQVPKHIVVVLLGHRKVKLRFPGGLGERLLLSRNVPHQIGSVKLREKIPLLDPVSHPDCHRVDQRRLGRVDPHRLLAFEPAGQRNLAHQLAARKLGDRNRYRGILRSGEIPECSSRSGQRRQHQDHLFLFAPLFGKACNLLFLRFLCFIRRDNHGSGFLFLHMESFPAGQAVRTSDLNVLIIIIQIE